MRRICATSTRVSILSFDMPPDDATVAPNSSSACARGETARLMLFIVRSLRCHVLAGVAWQASWPAIARPAEPIREDRLRAIDIADVEQAERRGCDYPRLVDRPCSGGLARRPEGARGFLVFLFALGFAAWSVGLRTLAALSEVRNQV